MQEGNFKQLARISIIPGIFLVWWIAPLPRRMADTPVAGVVMTHAQISLGEREQ